jgi:hypothetical protein
MNTFHPFSSVWCILRLTTGGDAVGLGYVTFDEEEKMMNFWEDNELQFSSRIGELLVTFLEIDFSSYESKRLEVIEAIKDDGLVQRYGAPEGELSTPALERLRAKIAYIFCCFGLIAYKEIGDSYFPRHDYFRKNNATGLFFGIKDTSDSILYFRADYKHQQEQIARIVDFCLNENVSVRSLDFTASQLYCIGKENGLFKLPLELESIRAGYFPSASLDPYKPFEKLEIYTPTIDGSTNPINLLSEEEFRLFKEIFENVPVKLIDGYYDLYPAHLAVLELMKMIQLDIRVRRCGICNRYFVVWGEHNAKYCRREPTDGTKSCRVIGAQRDARERYATDIWKEYRKARDRWNDRSGLPGTHRESIKRLEKEARKLIHEAGEDPVKQAAFYRWLENEQEV